MKLINSFFIFIALNLFFSNTGNTQSYLAGETYFGSNDFIEYKAGNLPIIISAPHGGSLEPAQIPNRDCASCVYVKDAFTEELIREIYQAVFDLFGCYPHIVINRLHRRKLDANRAIEDAANGNETAEQSWQDFHDFIGLARDTVTEKYGKGLYLDLHGHGHDIQRLELGYRITRSELQLPNATLNQTEYVDDASIRNLVNENLNQLSLSGLLRGADSFGELYEQEKFPAVPSKSDPFPFGNESYFSGGYNTERYGSKQLGRIDAIQIECNMDDVRDSETNRKKFATATALVLKTYLEKHYFGADFFNSNCDLILSNKEEKRDISAFIAIYPNPVLDVINVDLGAMHQGVISVVNELGQVLYQNRFLNRNHVQISTHDFPKGMYFVKVESKDLVGVKKVVK